MVLKGCQQEAAAVGDMPQIPGSHVQLRGSGLLMIQEAGVGEVSPHLHALVSVSVLDTSLAA